MKWNEVKDGILPKVDGYVIAVYDTEDSIGGRCRIVHKVFYDAEQKKFLGIFETELEVVAWMELPEYTEE